MIRRNKFMQRHPRKRSMTLEAVLYIREIYTKVPKLNVPLS